MPTKPKKSADPTYLRSLARGYTEASIKTLGGWAMGSKVEKDIRIRAIGMLLDRGWGKPAQPHTGEEGGAIEIVLRNIMEEKKKSE
jgi:hypothetical protein